MEADPTVESLDDDTGSRRQFCLRALSYHYPAMPVARPDFDRPGFLLWLQRWGVQHEFDGPDEPTPPTDEQTTDEQAA